MSMNQYKKEFASMGGKAVWANKTEEERKAEMSRRRKKGMENKRKKLEEDNQKSTRD